MTLILQTAIAAKMQGFRVFLATHDMMRTRSKCTHGFFTDEEGTRVVSFQLSPPAAGVAFSGNYKTSNPRQTGTGWRMTEELVSLAPLNFTDLFNQSAPLWAVKGADWRHTTLQEEMAAYDKSSKFEELFWCDIAADLFCWEDELHGRAFTRLLQHDWREPLPDLAALGFAGRPEPLRDLVAAGLVETVEEPNGRGTIQTYRLASEWPERLTAVLATRWQERQTYQPHHTERYGIQTGPRGECGRATYLNQNGGRPWQTYVGSGSASLCFSTLGQAKAFLEGARHDRALQFVTMSALPVGESAEVVEA